MSHKATILKQYRDLARNIRSFSDGQAWLSERGEEDEDTLEMVRVTISPNDGYYRGGKFEFELDLSDSYPSNAPSIRCLTRVYHPNIDLVEGDYSDGDVCLNLLDELFEPELTLEDYVQGLLFLFYNPNLDDPLNGAFDGGEDEEVFRRNIRRSMMGKEIDGIVYEQLLSSNSESDEEDSGKEMTLQEHEQETSGQTQPSTAKEENVKERERVLEEEDKEVVSSSSYLVVKDEATGQDLIASNNDTTSQETHEPAVPDSVRQQTLPSASGSLSFLQWGRIGLWVAVGMAVITTIPLLRAGKR